MRMGLANARLVSSQLISNVRIVFNANAGLTVGAHAAAHSYNDEFDEDDNTFRVREEIILNGIKHGEINSHTIVQAGESRGAMWVKWCVFCLDWPCTCDG